MGSLEILESLFRRILVVVDERRRVDIRLIVETSIEARVTCLGQISQTEVVGTLNRRDAGGLAIVTVECLDEGQVHTCLTLRTTIV